MALMMSSLYDALLAAGAGDEPARKAAEKVTNYDNRLAKMEGDLGIVKWMIGFNLAMTAAILAKMLV